MDQLLLSMAGSCLSFNNKWAAQWQNIGMDSSVSKFKPMLDTTLVFIHR